MIAIAVTKNYSTFPMNPMNPSSDILSLLLPRFGSAPGGLKGKSGVIPALSP